MNREAEKKRLIELIEQAHKKSAEAIHEHITATLKEKGRFNSKTDADRQSIYEIEADHLLDNGAIVPPCKVGDKVYKIVDMSHTACNSFITKETVEPYAVIHANVMGGYSCIPFEAFGKTVFLSEAEAKYALKNRRSVSLVDGHIEEA